MKNGMNESEYLAFRRLAQRKAHAMQLSDEVRKKYQKEYDQIVHELKEGIQYYVAYYITNGTNDLKKGQPVKHCTEIWGKVHDALRSGDLPQLDRQCEVLKGIFKGEVLHDKKPI